MPPQRRFGFESIHHVRNNTMNHGIWNALFAVYLREALLFDGITITWVALFTPELFYASVVHSDFKTKKAAAGGKWGLLDHPPVPLVSLVVTPSNP